ncbi:GhoT/OrtT family toxin, partial [Escherichia coli]
SWAASDVYKGQVIIWFISHEKTHIRLLSAFLVGITWPMSLPVALLFSLF